MARVPEAGAGPAASAPLRRTARWVALGACLVVAACGRVGYDPLGLADAARSDGSVDGSGRADGAVPEAGMSDAPPLDAVPCPDDDRDGHLAAVCGGPDCDDADPEVHPGAEGPEGAPSCANDRDDDCDGLVDAADPSCQPLDVSPLGVRVRPYLSEMERTYVALGDRVFFRGSDGARGQELWVTDGTAAGTVMLADADPAGDSSPWGLTPVGDRVFFFADDGTTGVEPWVTDGTPAGTLRLADIHPTGSSIRFHRSAAAGDRFVFQADDGVTGREPWVSDGTPAGTRQLADLVPGATGSLPYEAHALDGTRAVFRANAPPAGVELWVTDGTPAGTRLVVDAAPGSAASLPDGWFRYFGGGGGRLYYRGTDGASGLELWTTDGTAAGTRRVADVQPGAGDGVYGAPHPVVVGGQIYFGATGPEGVEPWISDGTEAGTRLLADVNPSGDAMVVDGRFGFTAAGGLVYFIANDGVHDFEPWVTDGAAAGTRLLRDVHPAGTSALYGFFVFEDTFFFSADDGVRGLELWRSDGTEAGTVIAWELRPGATASTPLVIGVTPTYALLAADGGALDRYLWVLR